MIKKRHAMDILQGKKLYEGRKSENLKGLKVGGTVGFHWCTSTRIVCDVLSISNFDNSAAMVHQLGHRELVPSSETPEDCCVSWPPLNYLWSAHGFSPASSQNHARLRPSMPSCTEMRLCQPLSWEIPGRWTMLSQKQRKSA